uniref:Uncharacterized protein n=1 Tax=Anopheles dirus TaxID=7168 RepID=A0A182NNE6_9DIPT
MNSSEWRPPEPDLWSPPSARLVSRGVYDQTGLEVERYPRADLSPSVTSWHPSDQASPAQSPVSLKSLETAEKHFLFRRDLSKTRDPPLRHTSPAARPWSDNGTNPSCEDSGSMDGNCTPNRERPPTLMTNASNANSAEDLLVQLAPNRSAATNESALWTLKDLELATLQSPLEYNHTTHSYPAVNLNDHNDVLCDDDSDQLEYNENCFIDHNVTCVGDPDFCNLTYGEYRQLLMDYIYPSTGEWILIASHTVVFLMGLTREHE